MMQQIFCGAAGAALLLYGPTVYRQISVSDIRFTLLGTGISCMCGFLVAITFGGFENGSKKSIFKSRDWWSLCGSITLFCCLVGVPIGLAVDLSIAGIKSIL